MLGPILCQHDRSAEPTFPGPTSFHLTLPVLELTMGSVLWTLAAPPQDFWSESGHTRGYNDDVRSDAALAFLLFNTRKDTIQADNNGLPVVGCSIANVVSVFEDWR